MARSAKSTKQRRKPSSPDRIAEAEQIFIDGVGREISHTWGSVSALAGRIFASLYLAGRPMDMDELSAKLGRSKSNVLINLRSLVSIGLATRAWVPGSRRDQYEVGGDYGNVTLRAFFRQLDENLENNLRAVEAAAALLRSVEPPEDPDRAAHLETMLERADRAVRFYKSMRKIYTRLTSSMGFDIDFVDLLQSVAEALDTDDNVNS